MRSHICTPRRADEIESIDPVIIERAEQVLFDGHLSPIGRVPATWREGPVISMSSGGGRC